MSSPLSVKGIFQSKPMSNQEAFDRVWQRFVVEKAPIASTGIACRYRLGDSHGCAIGVQLPDDLYIPSFEGASAFQLLMVARPFNGFQYMPEEEVNRVRRHFDRVAPALLEALQTAHDREKYSMQPDRGLAVSLRNIADDFGLHIPGGAA